MILTAHFEGILSLILDYRPIVFHHLQMILAAYIEGIWVVLFEGILGLKFDNGQT